MQKRLYSVALLIIALLIGVLCGGFYVTRALQAKKPEIISISSEIFANTLLIQDPKIKKNIRFYLVFPSGEAANPFDEGLAHYVEHLAWLSASGGSNDTKERHSNAWTNHFSTGYWQMSGGDDLYGALQRLVAVSKPFTVENAFALQERSIILREYDYRVAEKPLYHVYRDMNRVLYGTGTLARSLIGEPSAIAEYSLEDARTLHRQSHVLRTATLLIHGAVDKSQLEAALAALQAEQRSKPIMNSTSNDWVEDGLVKDKISLSISELAEDTLLYGKLVPLTSCDVGADCAIISEIAENALNSALAGGLAGPLRYERFVARSFSFTISIFGNTYAEINFTANPDSGVSLAELELAFQNAYRMTLENGLPPDTFARVKSRLRDSLDRILVEDRPDYNSDLVLGQLASAQPIFSLSDEIGALESIRLEDVNLFLASLLADGREVSRLVAAKR